MSLYDFEQTLTQGVPRVVSTPSGLHRVVGRGRFQHLGDFDIPGLPPKRPVTAYVPEDHVRDGTRGALYLFDGQNVFDDSTSFAGGWYAHDAIDAIRRRHRNIPVLIAINHGGEGRIDELCPWKMRMGGGKTDELLKWMIKKLLPLAEKEFALRTGPIARVVGGSSLGGLASLYAHFRHPEVFGGALCMSPSFWVSNRAIFKFVASQPNPYVSRIYLDCGGEEAGGRMLPLVAEMAEHLRGRGWDGRQLMWRPDPHAGHNERAWRRRLPRAFRFMFRA